MDDDYSDMVQFIDNLIDNIGIDTLYNGFDMPLHIPHIVHKIYVYNNMCTDIIDFEYMFRMYAPTDDFKVVLYRENGITLRDLFETVYALKCTKVDFWHELFDCIVLKYNHISGSKNNEQYKAFCNEIIENCTAEPESSHLHHFFKMSDFKENENLNFMVLEFNSDCCP